MSFDPLLEARRVAEARVVVPRQPVMHYGVGNFTYASCGVVIDGQRGTTTLAEVTCKRCRESQWFREAPARERRRRRKAKP